MREQTRAILNAKNALLNAYYLCQDNNQSLNSEDLRILNDIVFINAMLKTIDYR